jgi:6-phosphogluconate dehydrogenase
MAPGMPYYIPADHPAIFGAASDRRTGQGMQVGVVGLGKMGGAVARRLMQAGHDVIGLDQDRTIAASLAEQGVPCVEDLAALVAGLESPRVVWLMLPAGDMTQDTISTLAVLLAAGDLIVDAGNSYYRDSIAQHETLVSGGIEFVDAGASGGVAGLDSGFCLMLGGEGSAVARLEPLMQALASDGGRAWAHVGPAGAGHFVKMVHNGIEYGAMQAYAEGFALLEAKQEFKLDAEQIAGLWQQGSIVRSRLLDLIGELLRSDADLDDIEPIVADSGEGRWTAYEAIALGVSAPVMTLALMARFKSQDDSRYGERLLAALRRQFGGHAVTKKTT